MKVTILLAIAFSFAIVGIGTWAYERKILRLSLLMDESHTWTQHCRDTQGESCDEFVECCKAFPDMANCKASGGVLEYPICHYWGAKIKFDPKQHGNCGCIRKFIRANYKSKCHGEDEKKICKAFVSCCLNEDNGDCTRFVAGEFEFPACDHVEEKAFNYNQSVCRCALDSESPNVTMRTNVTIPPKMTYLPPLPTFLPDEPTTTTQGPTTATQGPTSTTQKPTPATTPNKTTDNHQWFRAPGSTSKNDHMWMVMVEILVSIIYIKCIDY